VNREVTREGFANFLAWLSPTGAGAGEEYERVRRLLLLFFSHRGCPFPEDLADETINRVILKLGETQIENKLAYCYGVARNVYRESLRRERPRLDIDEVQLAADAPAEPDFSMECLDKCLAELPPESRAMLLDYFSVSKAEKVRLHRGIAERLNLTQTALRMSIMRGKRRLEDCVRRCMGEGAVT
jgi:DNA-directed RNA polymerase specialized sigma24 family protein